MRRSATAPVILVMLAFLAVSTAGSQPPSTAHDTNQHVMDWSRIIMDATARIEVQDAGGTPLRQTYGTTIGDPPRIVTRLSSLSGGRQVTVTFRGGNQMTARAVLGFDPINDLAVLDTDGVLPRTPNPDETMKWRFQEKIYVIPGPDMGDDWPAQTSSTPLELGKLRIVPVTGNPPGGLAVMHDCGRWAGLTGRIEDETGSFSYITTIETVLPVLFAEPSPTPIEEAAASPVPFLDGASAAGLLVRGVLRGQEETEEAKPFFDLAKKRDPEMAEIPFWYGKILFREENFVEAEQAFREAFRLRPDWEDAYQMAGASANQQASYDIALQLYNEGLRVAPKSVKLRINKWGALYNLGRINEAVAVLKAALELDPKSDLALYNLGTTYLRMGKRLEAEEIFTQLESMRSRYAQHLRERLDE